MRSILLLVFAVLLLGCATPQADNVTTLPPAANVTTGPSANATSPDDGGQMCAQVITKAVNSVGVCKEFPTPCSVPQGWTEVTVCPEVIGSCGDGELDSGETPTSCCADAGCPDRQQCLHGACAAEGCQLPDPKLASQSFDTQFFVTSKTANKVVLTNHDSRTIWQYTSLNSPSSARRMFNGDALIADTGNGRVISVKQMDNSVQWEFKASSPVDALEALGGIYVATGDKVIKLNSETRDQTWSYDLSGASALAASTTRFFAGGEDKVVIFDVDGAVVKEVTGFSDVAGIDALPNGGFVVADSAKNLVSEYDQNGNKVWEYGGTAGCDAGELRSPQSVEKFSNNDYLIADSGNDRIVEISDKKALVWYYTSFKGPVGAFPV